MALLRAEWPFPVWLGHARSGIHDGEYTDSYIQICGIETNALAKRTFHFDLTLLNCKLGLGLELLMEMERCSIRPTSSPTDSVSEPTTFLSVTANTQGTK